MKPRKIYLGIKEITSKHTKDSHKPLSKKKKNLKIAKPLPECIWNILKKEQIKIQQNNTENKKQQQIFDKTSKLFRDKYWKPKTRFYCEIQTQKQNPITLYATTIWLKNDIK